ncbi:MAG: transcription antitermination factor NusB [Pseudomonadota bacterium]|nr:transcription antitermination factor NusB [Pseudomonadota bacterium]
MKSGNHNKKSSARLFAVQILFEMEINGKKINSILERLTDEYLIEISRLNKTGKADKNHLIKILKGVTKNQKDIDLNINDNLIGWSLSRIDSVSRAILRSALYELRECNDIPVKVIINEYIEISKSFFEGDEPNFINGILDKISKIYRPNEF